MVVELGGVPSKGHFRLIVKKTEWACVDNNQELALFLAKNRGMSGGRAGYGK